MSTISSKITFFIFGMFSGVVITSLLVLLLSDNISPGKFFKKITSRDTIVDKSVAFYDEQPKKIVPKAKPKVEQDDFFTDNQIEESSTIASNSESEIQVSKDELINILSFPLKDLDRVEIKKSSDSLLQQFEGQAVNQDKRNYQIEFWKSPINYKGYKMIRNRIVVFGLDPAEQTTVIKYENQIFLKSGSIFYALKMTDEFEALKKTEEDTKTKIAVKL